jgi:hypothetical protein
LRLPTEDIDQEQSRALLRRQELQCDDERKSDALALRCSLIGSPGGGVFRVEQCVGRGLDPQPLIRGRVESKLRARRCGADQVRQRSPTTTYLEQLVEAGVRRDLIEPCPYGIGRPYLVAPLPGSKQGLLGELFGVLERAQHSVAMQGDRAPMRLEKYSKGLVVRSRDHRAQDATGTFLAVGR